jgi:hypothetical protein
VELDALGASPETAAVYIAHELAIAAGTREARLASEYRARSARQPLRSASGSAFGLDRPSRRADEAPIRASRGRPSKPTERMP